MDSAARRRLACTFAIGLSAAIGLDWGLPSPRRELQLLGVPLPAGLAASLADDLAAGLSRRYGGPHPAGSQAPVLARIDLPGSIEPSDPMEPRPPLVSGLAGAFLLSADHDEAQAAIAARRAFPRRPDFDASWAPYGASYSLALRVFLLAAERLGLSPGGAPLDLEAPARARRLFLLGRAFSLAAALLCLWLLFIASREALGAEESLSPWLFGLSPLVMAQARVMKPHLWTTALCLAFTVAVLRCRKRPSGPGLAFAGVLLGLAAGSGLQSWVFVAWPLILLRPWHGRGLQAAGSLLAAAATALAMNPDLWLSGERGLAQLRVIAAQFQPRLDLAANAGSLLSVWLAGLGPPAAVAAALGLVSALWSAPRASDAWRLAAFLVAAFGVFSVEFPAVGALESRYALAPLALAVLFAPRGIDLLARVGGLGRPGRRAIEAAVLGCQFLGAVVMAAGFHRDASGASHADLAAEWIRAEVPAGSSIGLTLPYPTSDAVAPFPWHRYRLVYLPGNLSRWDPALFPDFFLVNGRSPWRPPADLGLFYRLRASFAAPLLLESWSALSNADFPALIYQRR